MSTTLADPPNATDVLNQAIGLLELVAIQSPKDKEDLERDIAVFKKHFQETNNPFHKSLQEMYVTCFKAGYLAAMSRPK